jgi:hypothetical protein
VNLLAPLFLVGAAAAAIPIVLHLLKREPEARIKFSAVRLLRRAPVEHTRRRHLRELLLLALRVTALLLLALAFARPFFGTGAASESTGMTIVALDTSLSLSAPEQWPRAKQLARAAIDSAPAGNLIAVLTFADTATVAAAPSADRGAARAAIDAATSGFGSSRYRALLNQAGDVAEGRRATVVVVTDLQESGWDAGDRVTLPASMQIEIADVGAMPPNLAVTSVRVANDRVIATVRNAAPEAREARVRLSIDERPAGEGAASIGAQQTADIALPLGQGSAAVVSVEDPDGIAGDNARFLVLGADQRPSVLLVTSDGNLARDAFYVQHALAAEGAGGAAYRIVGVGGVELATWDPERLQANAAVLVLSTRGLDRAGRDKIAEYVKEGGGVLVAAGPDVDGEVAAEALARSFTLANPSDQGNERPTTARAFAPADPRHPLFQRFAANTGVLGLPTFERVASIAGPGCETLARFTTGEPALLECAPGSGRALILASDLNRQWNDFPRHATFVPFLHETVNYLAGPRPRAAEHLIGGLPPGVDPQPGIVSLPGADGRLRPVAVNVDPAEADPARLTSEEFQTAVTRMQGGAEPEIRVENRQREERQRLWQYLLGAMLAIMLAESVVAARTG